MLGGVSRSLVTGLLYLLKVMAFSFTGVAVAGVLFAVGQPVGVCPAGPPSILKAVSCTLLNPRSIGLIQNAPSAVALAFCSVYLHVKAGKGLMKTATTILGGAPRAPIPHTRVSLYVGIRRYADAYLSYT